MSESQDNDTTRQPPVIDHAPAQDAIAPPERSAPPNPPPARRGGTPFIITLLLAAALGGGIYWAWTHPRDQPIDPQTAIDSVKAQIGQQIDQLSGRIAKLEQAPPPNTDALAALGKHIDDLAGHVNDLTQQQAQQSAALQKLQQAPAPAPETAAAPAASATSADQANPGGAAPQQLADLAQKLDAAVAQEKASLDTLTDRLGKLEQAQSGNASSGIAKAEAEADANKQALDALAGKVKSLEQGEGQIAGVKQDAALAVKLTAAQAALANGQPVGELPGAPAALSRFATAAPPTEAVLKAAFPAAASAALAASRPEEEQHSFFGRTLARLEESVTVRQGDHVIVGDPAAGVLDKARQALDNGDLKGAVQSLGALSGPAAKAMQPWVSQANALLSARAALASMAHS